MDSLTSDIQSTTDDQDGVELAVRLSLWPAERRAARHLARRLVDDFVEAEAQQFESIQAHLRQQGELLDDLRKGLLSKHVQKATSEAASTPFDELRLSFKTETAYISELNALLELLKDEWALFFARREAELSENLRQQDLSTTQKKSG